MAKPHTLAMQKLYKEKGIKPKRLSSYEVAQIVCREYGFPFPSDINAFLRAFSTGVKLTKGFLKIYNSNHYRKIPAIPNIRRKPISKITSDTEDTKWLKSKEFLSSYEWRELRYRVLAKYDGCCQCCGKSKKKHGIVLHVDHIKPRVKFPHLALEETNLQVLCEDCNLGKSYKDQTDWRPETPDKGNVIPIYRASSTEIERMTQEFLAKGRTIKRRTRKT